MVDKTKIKLIVDIIMFIDFLIVAMSGIVLKFVYPAAQGSGKAGVIFLFDRFGWLLVHDIVVLLFVILLLIHLVLGWSWIKCMLSKPNAPPTKPI